MKKTSLWEMNSIQFPRLLSEIFSIGLTDEQFRLLQASMELSKVEVTSLFERAEAEWQLLKGPLDG